MKKLLPTGRVVLSKRKRVPGDIIMSSHMFPQQDTNKDAANGNNELPLSFGVGKLLIYRQFLGLQDCLIRMRIQFYITLPGSTFYNL